MLKNETNPKPTGTLGFLPAGGRAHQLEARRGPAGSSGRPAPASGARRPARTGVSLCGARGGGHTASVLCHVPTRPGAQGHLGSWSQGVCRVLGSGTQSVHGQGKPKPRAQDPHWPAADNSGSYRRLRASASSAVPKWQTPRKPVEEFAGASDSHHPGFRERQAARWQRKRARGPGTRGRARAGAKVSVQPLPTTPGFPGQAGREQAGGLFLSSRPAR